MTKVCKGLQVPVMPYRAFYQGMLKVCKSVSITDVPMAYILAYAAYSPLLPYFGAAAHSNAGCLWIGIDSARRSPESPHLRGADAFPVRGKADRYFKLFRFQNKRKPGRHDYYTRVSSFLPGPPHYSVVKEHAAGDAGRRTLYFWRRYSATV